MLQVTAISATALSLAYADDNNLTLLFFYDDF